MPSPAMSAASACADESLRWRRPVHQGAVIAGMPPAPLTKPTVQAEPVCSMASSGRAMIAAR